MKLAVVVQRYGADISGGAELHARYIAERLARHVSVEVLTTCARDYVTWRNELPPGTEQVNGITVRSYDSVHLSEAGSDYVAAWLTPKLKGYAKRLAGKPDIVTSVGRVRDARKLMR